mgnify:CR=1 FL=1
MGRWGLDILEYIFPNYSMPWIYGIITITLMAVSICHKLGLSFKQIERHINSIVSVKYRLEYIRSINDSVSNKAYLFDVKCSKAFLLAIS